MVGPHHPRGKNNRRVKPYWDKILSGKTQIICTTAQKKKNKKNNELKMWVLTCSKTRELSNMYSNIPDRPLSQHLESVSVGETSVQKIIILTYTVSYNTNPVMEKACGLTISIPVPLVEPIL